MSPPRVAGTGVGGARGHTQLRGSGSRDHVLGPPRGKGPGGTGRRRERRARGFVERLEGVPLAGRCLTPGEVSPLFSTASGRRARQRRAMVW